MYARRSAEHNGGCTRWLDGRASRCNANIDLFRNLAVRFLHLFSSFFQVEFKHPATGNSRHADTDQRFIFCRCSPYLAQVMKIGEASLQRPEETRSAGSRIKIVLIFDVRNVNFTEIAELE